MKILIPGGHLTPALGLIDWILEHHPQVEIVFVGREYTQVRLKQKAIEFDEISKRGVEFVPFKTSKSPRSFLSAPIVSWQLLKSTLGSIKLIKKHQPSVLMSFGGYMAVPLALAAKLLGVPVITHEGTSVLGRANRLLFKLADKIAHSYPDLFNYNLKKLNKDVVLTGTPIRKKILSPVSPLQPDWLDLQGNKSNILLILGGSQGSLAINSLIKNTLSSLTEDWVVIHQCGRPNRLYHYKKELKEYAVKAGISFNRYFIKEWIDETDLAWIYAHAQAVVSRAGANTLEELRLYKLPAVLIPLPHSYAKEQKMNAKFFGDRQAARVIEQSQANSKTLLKELEVINKKRKEIRHSIAKLPLPDPREASFKIFIQLKAVC